MSRRGADADGAATRVDQGSRRAALISSPIDEQRFLLLPALLSLCLGAARPAGLIAARTDIILRS